MKMRDLMNLVEGSVVPYDHNQALHGELAGAHRENMTVQQAKEYLDAYPDGVLCHDGFPIDSFVAVNKFGIYVFYNGETDTLEHWSWQEDIAKLVKYYEEDETYDPLVDWWYNDAQEQFSITSGGMPFWDRIRNGLEIPE